MTDQLLTGSFQYAGYVVEAAICLMLSWQGRWRRHTGLCLYVVALFLLDGVARPAALSHFGPKSTQYFYTYWLTDVILALGAFLLVCAFFRRACAQDEKWWHFVRLVLISVLVLVLIYTGLNLTRHYANLYTMFIVEFSQNVYFSCLVLNTLLYVMIQQIAVDDDELGLLVCGLGVQFAGEAAGLAFYHLTAGDNFAHVFFSFLNPACTLGMLSVWIYALLKASQTATAGVRMVQKPALARAVATD